MDHVFPAIGHKVMILNARRIYRDTAASKAFPPIILLAMEDITEMMTVAKRLADHTNSFETRLEERTKNLEKHIKILEKEIDTLKEGP